MRVSECGGPAGFPYLTARNNGQMLRYRPRFRDAELAARPLNQAAAEQLGPGLTPLYPAPLERLAIDVQTPAGEMLAIDDPALRTALATKNVDADNCR